MKRFTKAVLAIMILISLSGITGCDTSSFITTSVQYTNPSWAPVYSPGVRYYYLPDIETYYDLSGQNFVYLDNGQWIFSSSLPPMYSGYDLYEGFVIALNSSIYQPWIFHQNYISHYPRYYYHNLYKEEERKNIRGFNENDRKPFFWRQQDRDRINDLRKNDRIERKPQPVRQPQQPVFRGKEIGQPVKVKPRMREPRSNNRPDTRTENRKDSRKNGRPQ